MEVHEVHDYLKREGYIKVVRGQYAFTQKYFEALAIPKPKVIQSKGTSSPTVVPAPVQALSASLSTVLSTLDWPARYIAFIQEAKVPPRLEDGRGGMYYANKYSEEGAKAFRKILEVDKAEYQVLVKSTMLYYKSGTRYKKKIGNYIVDGDWRSDYTDLVEKFSKGEKEVTQHIKDQLDDGQHTQYSALG